jgi:hypothetical protein
MPLRRENFIAEVEMLFIGISAEGFNRNRHCVPQEKIVASFSTHRVFFS